MLGLWRQFAQRISRCGRWVRLVHYIVGRARLGGFVACVPTLDASERVSGKVVRAFGRRACQGLFALLPIGMLCLAGCEVPVAEFQPNRLHAKVLAEKNQIENFDPAVDEISRLLVDYFGTPDDPKLPQAMLEEDHWRH